MLAGAEVVAGDPGATTSSAVAASATPKYALKNSAATDTNVATAGYVKGAYNAIIKGINATQGEIDTINTNIGTYSNTVEHLLDNTATQTGTVATVNAATTSESIATSSVNITGVTTSSISATASGDVNLSVPVMDNWATDGEATNPVQTTTSFSGLAVNGLSMTAPGTNNTATMTKRDISVNLNVAEYEIIAHINLNEIIGTLSTNQITANDGSGAPYSSNYRMSNSVIAGDPMAFAVNFAQIDTIIKGHGVCSTQGGSMGTTVTSLPNSSKPYCWCRLDGLIHMDTTLGLSSAFVRTGYAGNSCKNQCADSCATATASAGSSYKNFRTALFTPVQ